MQRLEDKEKECPVCYEQGKRVIKICENNHKVCEKCLFSLRKRQCPICKCHFKIKKSIYKNSATYEVLFSQEDKQHNGIAAEEDIREEQQAIRQYYERSHIFDTSNPHHQYQYHPSSQYNGQFSYPSAQLHSNYQFQQRQSQQQQEPYEIISQRQHQTFMRDPEYRENFNEQIRIIRRNRDQQMYTRQIREPNYQNLDLSQTFNEEEKLNCGLLDKIGQFFIRIGQSLTSKKEQELGRKVKNKEENEEVQNSIDFEEENIQGFNNEINQNMNNQQETMERHSNQQNMRRDCQHHQHYNNSHHNLQQYHHPYIHGVTHKQQHYNFLNVPDQYQYQYQHQPNHNYPLHHNLHPYPENPNYLHQHYYNLSYQQNRLENPLSYMQYPHNRSIQHQYSHYHPQDRYD